MTPSEMQVQIVRDQASERLRDAARRRDLQPVATGTDGAAVCIRLAGEGDAAAMKRLSDLEGRALTQEDTLVAIVEGNVIAAVGLASGETLADPFHHTAEIVGKLIDARAHMLGLVPRRGRGALAFLRRLGGGRSAPRAAGAPAVPGSESLLIR